MNHENSKSILVNARILSIASNGQKRVASELIKRIPNLQLTKPGKRYASGLTGHIWEQIALPAQGYKRRLWSPSTSGPIAHPNQIVTVHDIAFVDGAHWFSRSFALLYTNIVGRLVHTAKHIVTVSNFTRDRLIQHYNVAPAKISTIYSGRSAAFYKRSQADVEQFLDKFNIAKRQYIVAFRGSDPRKNFHTLADAWGVMSKQNHGAILVTFGRDSNKNVFSNSSVRASDSTIIHIGELTDDEMACLYSGALGFVFPSFYEGFGLPIIEAESCGCQVVTSNISALPEVCSSDAILVDPNSVSDIIFAIQKILNGSINENKYNNRISSAARFDWDLASLSYIKTFAKEFD